MLHKKEDPEARYFHTPSFIVCLQRLSYSTLSLVSFSCCRGGLIRHRPAVQIEHRLAAIGSALAMRKRYSSLPLERISPQLQHAVLAAEGARFFHHHGFHRKEIVNAVGEDLEGNRSRGASTIT